MKKLFVIAVALMSTMMLHAQLHCHGRSESEVLKNHYYNTNDQRYHADALRSATGTTKAAAEKVAHATGAELFEIKPYFSESLFW